MKPAYLVGGILFVAFVALGVYYLIPGPPKLIVFDDYNGVHVKHSLLSFALGIISIVTARFIANAQSPRAN